MRLFHFLADFQYRPILRQINIFCANQGYKFYWGGWSGDAPSYYVQVCQLKYQISEKNEYFEYTTTVLKLSES